MSAIRLHFITNYRSPLFGPDEIFVISVVVCVDSGDFEVDCRMKRSCTRACTKSCYSSLRDDTMTGELNFTHPQVTFCL